MARCLHTLFQPFPSCHHTNSVETFIFVNSTVFASPHSFPCLNAVSLHPSVYDSLQSFLEKAPLRKDGLLQNVIPPPLTHGLKGSIVKFHLMNLLITRPEIFCTPPGLFICSGQHFPWAYEGLDS